MRRIAAILALAAIAGCTVGPTFRKPEIATAARYAAPPGGVASTTYGGAIDTAWWTRFGDPELDALIGRLAAQNLDLQSAAERIAQAQAEVTIERSQAIPHLSGTASYTRKRQSPNGFASLVEPSPGAPLTYSQYQPGVSASWEVDLFGRVRRQVEAARADALAQVESRRALALSAIAELAQDYMQLRQAQAQEDLLRRTVAVSQARSRLVRDRFRQGAATSLDVAQADAQLSSIQQDLPSVLRQEAALANGIALLLAAPPRTLDAELAARPGVQPTVPPAVPVGLPGDLIRQRPDIREAEARLHAATAQTGVAVADFYPDIRFTGSFGFDSLRTPTLFDWASRTFTVMPSLSLPIFEGGRLKGNLELARSQQREAAIAFHRAVLQAWHDVDNALTAYARAQQTRADAMATALANQRGLAAAQQQYDEGATDFLNVVAQQSDLLGSRNAVVQANAGIETSLIALYKALGGGWQAVPDPKLDPRIGADRIGADRVSAAPAS